MYSFSWKEANINGKVRTDFSKKLAFGHTATKDFINLLVNSEIHAPDQPDDG